MEINVKKSKVMGIAKDGNLNLKMNIKYKNEELEKGELFEYLEMIITCNGRYDEEIINRKRKANSMYYQFNKTIMGKKEITMKTKTSQY